jgi:membrane protease YdiL (CAAX protease family)
VDPESAPRAVARVRWGLPDVAVAWFIGVVASFFALPLADPNLSQKHQPVRFLLAALVLQSLGTVVWLIVVSKRKGQDSLGKDFGISWPFDRLKVGAVVGWLGLGAALSIGAQVLLLPIDAIANLKDSAQEVSQALEHSSGAGRVLFGLAVVLVAPPVEELLFRGALLRSLQRRWSAAVAIFASAAIFAGIHVVGDPGAGYVVPGLLLLGLISGYQAVKTGNIVRSMLLHMGFNLLSAVALVVK